MTPSLTGQRVRPERPWEDALAAPDISTGETIYFGRWSSSYVWLGDEEAPDVVSVGCLPAVAIVRYAIWKGGAARRS